MNERTRSFIKNISLTLYSRLLRVRDELETGTDCYIDPSSSCDHSCTSSSSWLGLLNRGHWGPKALCLPLALTSASCPQLTRTVCAPGYIVYVHLLPLFFHLFTQVHLLIDGSVKGQYITRWTIERSGEKGGISRHDYDNDDDKETHIEILTFCKRPGITLYTD